MNGIQKGIKYCAMAFATVLAIGIFSVIATMVTGIAFGVMSESEYEERRERVNLSKQYSAEEIAAEKIDSIFIDCNGEIVVEIGDILSVEAVDITKDYELRCEDGRISLKRQKSDFDVFWGAVFSWFDNATVQEKVVVTIPEEFVPKQVQLYSGSGKVAVDEVTADLLLVDSGSGRVTVVNSEFKTTALSTGSGSVKLADCSLGSLSLDSGSGAVAMEHVVAKDADINSGSGAIAYEGELTGDCNFDSGSGSVSLILNGNEEDYRIEADSGSGSFRVNGRKLDDGSYGSNVKGKLSFDSGSGSVSVEFVTPEA